MYLSILVCYVSANASVNVLGSDENSTELEVFKNGVRVAGAEQGDSTSPGNITIMFRDTPDEDSEYDIRLKVNRDRGRAEGVLRP